MKVTPLFEIILPDLSASMAERVARLQAGEIRFDVSQDNFINYPWLLNTPVSGKRKLSLGEITSPLNQKQVIAELEKMPPYSLAYTEDFLELPLHEEFIQTAGVGSMIIYPYAGPRTPVTWMEDPTLYMVVGNNISEHIIDTAEGSRVFPIGTKVLLVSK